MMENKGQIYATDDDKRRLAPIHERLARSGARNVQVRTPKSVGDAIADLAGRIDLVLIDAPCTGTGAWRRNPDAKWRMRPGALEQRVKEQAEILDRAVPLLKAGGRIAYITCSVLDEENGAQVRAFLARHPEFSVAAAGRGRQGAGRARLHVRQGGAAVGRRSVDDAAHDRDRRIFRQRCCGGRLIRFTAVNALYMDTRRIPLFAAIPAKIVRDDFGTHSLADFQAEVSRHAGGKARSVSSRGAGRYSFRSRQRPAPGARRRGSPAP